MLVVALFSTSGLPHAQCIVHLQRQHGFSFPQVHSLSQPDSEQEEWAEALQVFLTHRQISTHRHLSFPMDAASGTFHPDTMSQHLLDLYATQQEPIAWLFTHAHPLHATGVFKAFQTRLQRGHNRDIAVCLEARDNDAFLHLFYVKGHRLEHREEALSSDLTVEEHCTLLGRTLRMRTSLQIWPTNQQNWGDRTPTYWSSRRLAPMRYPLTQRLYHDASFRHAAKEWKAGPLPMQYPSGKMAGIDPHAFLSLYQHAVCERFHQLLSQQPHNVIEARTLCTYQGHPFSLLLTLKSGHMLGLSATLSTSPLDYHNTRRALHTIAGPHARLFQVLPWFPRYLNPTNCDDETEPWFPMKQNDNGEPVFAAHHTQLQQTYTNWKELDQLFGESWHTDQARPPLGHRPPDTPKHPHFATSLIIPFDAGNTNGEGIFETRIRQLIQ
jgi:hypothetical protein